MLNILLLFIANSDFNNAFIIFETCEILVIAIILVIV